MTPQQQVIKEVEELYVERFEEWPEYHDDILINILCSLLIREREKNYYIKNPNKALVMK